MTPALEQECDEEEMMGRAANLHATAIAGKKYTKILKLKLFFFY